MNTIKKWMQTFQTKSWDRRLIALVAIVLLLMAALYAAFKPPHRMPIQEPAVSTVGEPETVLPVRPGLPTSPVRPAQPVDLIPPNLIAADRPVQVVDASGSGSHREQPGAVATQLPKEKDLKQQALATLAARKEAPAVLTPSELNEAIAELARRNGAEPNEVEVDIEGYEASNPDLFSSAEGNDPVAKTAKRVEPKMTKAPVFGWVGPKETSRFHFGQSLPARLLSDVVATEGVTHAIAQVFDPLTFQPLGLTLLRVTKATDAARIGLEGTRIVEGRGHEIRGRFAAFREDGAEGLIGRTKIHVARHLGLRLYRTALGVLPLRAASDDSLASVIATESGTSILDDLAGEIGDEGLPRTVFLPRGTRFRLVFLGAASVDETLAGTTGSALPFPGLGATPEPEAREKALGAYMRRLATSPKGKAPSLEAFLSDPGYLQELN
ncbi:hypothetical protein SCOR_02385 [Sulfidibacter corallicola]|uniref:Uncharacterized protein n=1 Tax=Sulfidibacter corallicola TaxID=2818388 RepID=A0A8A4TIL1_SULCO|nr:hypothetical protein [Sulfidibacter corallicola]QTD48628.1 hypothetical protein J3U87_23860 [Sulfidibacter corallicola]